MKNMKRSHFSGLIKKTGLAVIASTFLLAAPIAQAAGPVKPAVVYDTAGKNDKSFSLFTSGFPYSKNLSSPLRMTISLHLQKMFNLFD